MFTLRKQVEYAIFLLKELSLAPRETSVSIRYCAATYAISPILLHRIARQLRDAGMIIAKKGPSGGYQLNEPLTAISLLRVVEAVEGPFMVVPCQSARHVCAQSSHCTIRPSMDRVRTTVRDTLAETFLSSL